MYVYIYASLLLQRNPLHITPKKSVYHEICHNSCLIACDVRHAQHIGGVAGSESTMWCVIQNWDQFPVQTSRHATRNKRRRIAKKYLIRVQEHPSLLSTAFHEILLKKKSWFRIHPHFCWPLVRRHDFKIPTFRATCHPGSAQIFSQDTLFRHVVIALVFLGRFLAVGHLFGRFQNGDVVIFLKKRTLPPWSEIVSWKTHPYATPYMYVAMMALTSTPFIDPLRVL